MITVEWLRQLDSPLKIVEAVSAYLIAMAFVTYALIECYGFVEARLRSRKSREQCDLQIEVAIFLVVFVVDGRTPTEDLVCDANSSPPPVRRKGKGEARKSRNVEH